MADSAEPTPKSRPALATGPGSVTIMMLGIGAAIAVLVVTGPATATGWVCAVVTATLGVLAAIDLAEHRLPNWIVLRLAIFVSATVLAVGIASGEPNRALRALALGAIVGLALVAAGYVRMIGMGDAKLAGPLVAVLAWLDPASLSIAAAATLLSSAIYVLFEAIRARTLRFRFAFGPFMAIGFVVAVLVSPGG